MDPEKRLQLGLKETKRTCVSSYHAFKILANKLPPITPSCPHAVTLLPYLCEASDAHSQDRQSRRSPMENSSLVLIKKGEEKESPCSVRDGHPLCATGRAQAVKLTAEMPPQGAGPGSLG